MKVDKYYCMSSYLVFRYIEDGRIYFAEGFRRQNIKPLSNSKRVLVHTAEDLNREIHKVFDSERNALYIHRVRLFRNISYFPEVVV